MTKRNIIFTLFILLALIQIIFSAKMIFDSERILDSGNEFWFKTAPIDPNDPFRGKYITLNFDENSIVTKTDELWYSGDKIYVSFTSDSTGFAKIENVSKDLPDNTSNYVLCEVSYAINGDTSSIVVNYPFTKYYMEETKANNAEIIYNDSAADTTSLCYAQVLIKNGEARIKDIIIDGKSLK